MKIEHSNSSKICKRVSASTESLSVSDNSKMKKSEASAPKGAKGKTGKCIKKVDEKKEVMRLSEAELEELEWWNMILSTSRYRALSEILVAYDPDVSTYEEVEILFKSRLREDPMLQAEYFEISKRVQRAMIALGIVSESKLSASESEKATVEDWSGSTDLDSEYMF